MYKLVPGMVPGTFRYLSKKLIFSKTNSSIIKEKAPDTFSGAKFIKCSFISFYLLHVFLRCQQVYPGLYLKIPHLFLHLIG